MGKEDLNLPEGEQAEAKDTEPSVEAAEPVASANIEEDHGASTAEINLVTEKGATSMEGASTSETRNIAAEISALLDAPEEADEIESIGMIEDEDKSITNDNTEAIITEEEDKQVEEVHTPASIVDTILAAARSASVEQTKEEEQDPSLDNEETEVSEENFDVVESTIENKIEPEKLEEAVAQDSKTVDHKEKVVPAELMEAAHSIVDSVLEKAKAIVIEKTAQTTAPESMVEIIVSKSPEQDISDTHVTEAFIAASEEIKEQYVTVEDTKPQEMSTVTECTEPEIENLGSIKETIEDQTTKDTQLEEPIEDAQLEDPIEDSPSTEEKTEAPTPIIIINQDSVEIDDIINSSTEEEIHEAIEEPIPIDDSHPIENQAVPDLVEDLALKAEKVENLHYTTDEFTAVQTEPTENICEEISHTVIEQATNTTDDIEV